MSSSMSALEMAESILKDYRSLDCSVCNQFFGYMHRQTGEIFCSSTCLSTGFQTPPPPVKEAKKAIKEILVRPNQTPPPPVKEAKKAIKEILVEANQTRPPPVKEAKKAIKEILVEANQTRPPPVKDTNKAIKEILVDPNQTPPPTVKEAKKAIKEILVRPSPIVLPESVPLKNSKNDPLVATQDEIRSAVATKQKNPFGNKSGTGTTNAAPERKSTSSSTDATDGMSWDKTSGELNPFVKTRPPAVKDTESAIKEILVNPSPTVLKLRSELKWSSEPDDFMGQTLSGAKCNDLGPKDFCFQTDAMFKQLDALQRAIAAFCGKNKPVPLENLELGKLVFATFAGETFRGEIIGIPKMDVADVFFVDYGNISQIPRVELSALAQEFFDVPRLCFHCQWDYWLYETADEEPSASLVAKSTDRYLLTETEGVAPLIKVGDGQYVVAIGPKEGRATFTVEDYYKADKIPLKPDPAEQKLKRPQKTKTTSKN